VTAASSSAAAPAAAEAAEGAEAEAAASGAASESAAAVATIADLPNERDALLSLIRAAVTKASSLEAVSDSDLRAVSEFSLAAIPLRSTSNDSAILRALGLTVTIIELERKDYKRRFRLEFSRSAASSSASDSVTAQETGEDERRKKTKAAPSEDAYASTPSAAAGATHSAASIVLVLDNVYLDESEWTKHGIANTTWEMGMSEWSFAYWATEFESEQINDSGFDELNERLAPVAGSTKQRIELVQFVVHALAPRCQLRHRYRIDQFIQEKFAEADDDEEEQ
jgi:hypothetical protein